MERHRYRLRDATGDDLGVVEHTSAELRVGELVLDPAGQLSPHDIEFLRLARFDTDPARLTAPLESD